MQYTTAVFLLAIVPCFCQRPFYAGLQPIGYPDGSGSIEFNKRFGQDLPAQLNGDTAYADRLEKLPPNQQPIWFLNQKETKQNLNNPQNYPQRPSIFNDRFFNNV